MNSAIETRATQESNYQKPWPCTPRLPKTDLANLPDLFLEYASRFGFSTTPKKARATFRNIRTFATSASGILGVSA